MDLTGADRSPRVLHVVLSLRPGGTERLVIELATRLHPEMPTVIACLDEPGDWAQELAAHRIAVETLGRRPGFRPALALAVSALARQHRAAVIHAHHYTPFVYSALARLRSPALKLVFTEHGRVSDDPPSPRRRLANHVLSRLPHRVFTVSRALKGHLVAEGFADSAVDVIPNGIHVGPLPDAATRADVRHDLRVDDQTIVIGTIARLDPVKDLRTLIDAVACLPPGLSVVVMVVGDGEERARLEQGAAERGVTAQVRFLGLRQDARRWLAGCDVYVNCSISEGVSLTILEAMAAGLPIVATRVGGTPEVVDEACSVLIDPRDPAALAAAMAALGRDSVRRSALGRAARRRVEATLTIERMVAAYRDVYRQLAGPVRPTDSAAPSR